MDTNRTLHRWISIPLVLLFITIALTGVGMQAYLWINNMAPAGHEPKTPKPVPILLPATAERGIATASREIARRYPDEMLRGPTIDKAGVATFSLVETAGPRVVREVSVDLASGAILRPSASTDKAAKHWFFILLQDVHAGYIGGTLGRIIVVIAGAGLLMLSGTGLIVYLKIFRRRLTMRKRNPFWK